MTETVAARSDLRSAAVNEQFDTRDETGASDARNNATFATSSGSPMRPIGIVDTIRAITSADCRLAHARSSAVEPRFFAKHL